MNTATAQAQRHITKSVLAAAWRENLAQIRDNAQQHHDTITITLANTTITAAAAPRDFNQIAIHGPITANNTTITDPVQLLQQLCPQPPQHVLDEISNAVRGLASALENTHHITRIQNLAKQHRTATTVALATKLQQHHEFLPCRFYEPLATHGHHLHPMARTRLGWTTNERDTFDLETHQPTHLRIIAVTRDTIAATPNHHGHHLDTLLAADLPQISPQLHDSHFLVPVHPWQYQHVLRTRHAEAFKTGQFRDTGITVAAFPTSSVRTLVTHAGIYLKCSLDIHITSTRRGISPATVHNGPILSPAIENIINTDPALKTRVAIIPEHAGMSLPPEHPHARDLSCILRGKLTTTLNQHEHPIPATALAAHSPVTGQPILIELVNQRRLITGMATAEAASDFLSAYADRLVTAALVLAGRYGIGIEGHMQNCVPTFSNGRPCRVLLRDLGGARIYLPRLRAAGYAPKLHPHSVITTNDIDTMRNKVSYTVFQNHLAEVVNLLSNHGLLPRDRAWRTIAQIVTRLDVAADDLAPFIAPTVSHKALLTMRLAGGNDRYVPVANPIHQS